MGYLKKISSLEEKASAQVAINLCQENGFKEVALCLEKPTYGAFIHMDGFKEVVLCSEKLTYGAFIHMDPSPLFISDPEKLSIWAKMKENNRSSNVFMRSCYLNDKERVEQWDAAIDEQCQRLTEGLPSLLKHGVHVWINRIALEYLSYCRRQEVLFGVSRYFLMGILTRGDWTEAGRLDEEKLAKRLLKDEQLTVLQQYRIACVYCLHVDIPQLWKRLTQEEKQSISGNDNRYFSQESNLLVLLWSYYFDGHREKIITHKKNHLWTYGVQQAVCYGNQAALKQCWKGLEEHVRQQMAIDMALQSLQVWQSIQNKLYVFDNCRKNLLSNKLPFTQSVESIKHFNLPSDYSELVCVFLSEMDQEQQLTFFKKAFQSKYCDSVLECFLDWPHQDDFLPTINQLWGIIPKGKYGQCLLTLAIKYSKDYENENHYYDYRSLIWKLWEETPEEYKRYVFCDKKPNSVHYGETVINEGKVLLPLLLKRSPFQEKDEALFKRVLCDLSQEERKVIMLSEAGEKMCSILMQKERWSFVNWLQKECLPKEEIPSFRKQFIQSYWGCRLCSYKLAKNCEKLLDDLIDLSFEFNTEKTQFKNMLIHSNSCLNMCKSLLSKGEFTEVQRMINFCLSSDEMKKQIKMCFARYTCIALLNDCAWEQMNEILAWGFDAEEKIRDFKKDLFSFPTFDIHYRLVFIEQQWEEVRCFYKWFCLSPKEIEEIKKETIFSSKAIQHIKKELFSKDINIRAPLFWCLTDEKMVISFKKIFEKYFVKVFDKKKKTAKARFYDLVNQLLYSRRTGKIHDKTSRKGSFAEDKGEESSSVVENESSSPRKRCRYSI